MQNFNNLNNIFERGFCFEKNKLCNYVSSDEFEYGFSKLWKSL